MERIIYTILHEDYQGGESTAWTSSRAYASREKAEKALAEYKAEILAEWSNREAEDDDFGYDIGYDTKSKFFIHGTCTADSSLVEIEEMTLED